MAFLTDMLVTKMLEGMVEVARQYLADSGFARWTLKRWNNQSKNADFPELFGLDVLLENLLLTGVNDFVVHRMYFNTQESKLYFDVSIPKINFSMGKGELNFNFFGANSTGKAKGNIAIFEPRILGEVVLNISDDMDFTLRRVDVQFKLKAIKSKVNIKINNVDYSNAVNTFLMKTIPGFIKKHETEINEGLAKTILQARR